MLKEIMPALKATLVLAVLTGLLFPLAVTALSQLIFPEQANGSLVRDKTGRVFGSKLIGQQFTRAEYFHPRPSAAGGGYAGEASGGTNLGPTSSKLIGGIEDDPATADKDESYAGVRQLAERYRRENLLERYEKVPVDAVSRSGSGLDPHISKANALLQARRVASARALRLEQVVDLVERHTEPRQFALLGEPRVNVLMINLVLDEVKR